MTIKAQNLPNYNEALTTNWQLVFSKFPEIDYFAQSVTIPSISVSGTRTNFKNQRMFSPDNLIDFGQLTVTFTVDEDFNNYDALLREFFNQEKNTDGTNKIRDLLHDVSVIRMSSNKVPIATFKFTDASLNSLGSINYTSTGAEPDILVCDATFNVTQMYIIPYRNSNNLDGTLTCKV